MYEFLPLRRDTECVQIVLGADRLFPQAVKRFIVFYREYESLIPVALSRCHNSDQKPWTWDRAFYAKSRLDFKDSNV